MHTCKIDAGRPEEYQPTTSYAETLQERLEQVHTFARQRLKLWSGRMKRYYDIGTTESKLEVGDAVWLHNPQRKKGLSPKLQKPWQGPYVIMKRINDLIYRIQLGPRSKPRVVHFIRLWKYHGEKKPRWLIMDPAQPDGAPESPKTAPDRIDSGMEVLDALSTESISSKTVPALGDSALAPRRSSRQRRRPDHYGVGHPRRVTLEEGAV